MHFYELIFFCNMRGEKNPSTYLINKRCEDMKKKTHYVQLHVILLDNVCRSIHSTHAHTYWNLVSKQQRHVCFSWMCVVG